MDKIVKDGTIAHPYVPTTSGYTRMFKKTTVEKAKKKKRKRSMKAMKAKRSMKAMKVKIAKGDGGTEKKIVKDHGSTEKNSGRRLFYNRCYHNMQKQMMKKMS